MSTKPQQVAGGVDLTTLWERLRLSWLASKPTVTAPDPKKLAGNSAESTFHQLSAGDPGVSACVRSVRLKDASSGRRREIDSVVLTPSGLTVVELKNWSGTVRPALTPQLGGGRTDLPSDGWEQVRRNKEVVFHGNPVHETRVKASLLQQYIHRTTGVHIDESFIKIRVVFMNSNCAVSDSILADPHVVPFARWRNVALHGDGECPADSQSNWLVASLYAAFAQLVGGSAHSTQQPRVLHDEELTIISRALHELPTWDLVTLLGGECIAGDFIAATEAGSNAQVPAIRDLVRETRCGDPQASPLASYGAVFHASSPSRSFLANAANAVLGHAPATTLRVTPRIPASQGGPASSWMSYLWPPAWFAAKAAPPSLGVGGAFPADGGAATNRPDLVIPIDNKLVFRPAGSPQDVVYAFNDVVSFELSRAPTARKSCRSASGSGAPAPALPTMTQGEDDFVFVQLSAGEGIVYAPSPTKSQ